MAADGRVSVPLTLSSCRLQGKKAIIGFAGISSRSQLDTLIGAVILIDKKALPEPGDDQFYWCNYIGRPVVTDDGRQLGLVETIFSNGAQDVLVLRQETEEEILIPVTRETLVDDSKETLIVALPPGLLEINCPPAVNDDI